MAKPKSLKQLVAEQSADEDVPLRTPGRFALPKTRAKFQTVRGVETRAMGEAIEARRFGKELETEGPAEPQSALGSIGQSRRRIKPAPKGTEKVVSERAGKPMRYYAPEWLFRPEPSRDLRLAAAVLKDTVIDRLALHGDLPIACETELLRAFRAIFGCQPEQAWVVALMQRVQDTKLDRLRREANPSTKWGGVWTSDNHLEAAAKTLAAWPRAPSLPAWVDGMVFGWLVGKYGFDGGGGERGTMSHTRMVRLLTAPAELRAAMLRDSRKLKNRAALRALQESASKIPRK